MAGIPAFLEIAGKRVDDPARLLSLRATLPGAYGYDRSAHALRVAAAKGVGLRDRLALALHGSWMVNARATSPVFRKWLDSALGDAWNDLDAALAQGWRTESRDIAQAAANTLCAAGAGVASLSKVLALLHPQSMLLMDDHALAYLGLAVEVPTGEEKGTAGPEHFAPALDAFSSVIEANFDGLVGLAQAHADVVLDAAQVLDRVLWMASYGRRFFPQLTA